MITKSTEYKRLNMEYGIWNMEYGIQFLSTFHIPNSARRGFTLVETMVAITILLVAVVTPISLIGNALHNLYYARDQMVAINLAQEGIEVVRQKRDSNMLGGVVSWDEGLTEGDYIINTPTLEINSCSSCDTKIYEDADGFYGQGTGQGTPIIATQFTSRTVVITDIIPDQKKVVSTVTWKTGGQTGTVTASEYLFKWAL